MSSGKKERVLVSDVKEISYAKRVVVMIVGIIVIGLGITMFRFSLMGNDPFSAFSLGLAGMLGLKMTVTNVIINGAFFFTQLIWGRDMIGVGSFVNWFGLGLSSDLWKAFLEKIIVFPESFAGRFIVMIIGVIITCIGVSLYQTPNVGIAPYDALSIIMSRHLPIHYFWCRMITDSVCAVLAYATGSIVGLGTLISAIGLGPIIVLSTRTIARPILGIKKEYGHKKFS